MREPYQKCRDIDLFCEFCNGCGVIVKQPLSAQAIYALGKAVPDEPVVIIEERCRNCGGSGKDPIKAAKRKG